MKLLLLAMFFSVALPFFAHAGSTYYVAKNGSDSRSCSQATSASTPKLTINGSSGGLRCLKAGDTLIIDGGTYAEVFNPGDVPSGTSWSAPVTLKAASGDTVTIRPNSGNGSGDVMALSVTGSYTPQYIVFDRLNFDGSNVSVQVVRVSAASHHIRFTNGSIRNAPKNNCFFVQDSSTKYIELINMTIDNCGNSTQHHGVYIRGQNALVEKSRISNHSGHGVHVYSSTGQVHNNIIRNNEIYQNGSWGVLIGSGKGNQAYNNIVRNNKAGMRIGYYSPASSQLYNNTIYSNGNYCVYVNSESYQAAVRNNICYQNAYNMVKNLGSSSVISNTLTTDPKFANASNKDFRLLSSSPAINKGVTLSQVPYDYVRVSRPQGSSHDIGAYEYASSSSSVQGVWPTDLRVVDSH